jgi:SAM-dependent methyltransferase
MTSTSRRYESAILAHYKEQAQRHGDSSSCTMEDDFVRAKETKIIRDCVSEFIRSQMDRHCEGSGTAEGPDHGGRFHIVDLGCGNGTTLQSLIDHGPMPRGCSLQFTGLEYSPDMRKIAEDRFRGVSNVTIVGGDVRSIDKTLISPADIVIHQRVLINLLDPADQCTARDCIIDLLSPAGLVIALEGFRSGLDNLNAARVEFGLDPLESSHHNLYLPDGFFDHKLLEPWKSETLDVSPEVFSTHDFVSRVFHEAMLRATDTPFERNSHFVKFFSEALPDGIGSYARVKVMLRRKVIEQP